MEYSSERERELQLLSENYRVYIARFGQEYDNAAFDAEVCCHIFSVFTYEAEALEDDFALVMKRARHELAHSEENLVRPAACRAFVWFMRHTCHDTVLFQESELIEWIPTDARFKC